MAFKCILGSQSPRRQQLMEILGFPFEVRVSDVDEDFAESMNVREVAEYLANKKAATLIPTLSENEILITADSTVICDDMIYNKPMDKEDAVRMLSALSGKKHEVITGVCIGTQHNQESFSDTTFVEFAEMSQHEIQHYVDLHKPLDKAGAYGIQDWIGMALVTSIQGSYTNVMGLPTHRVYHHLKKYFMD